jgi:type I restriction enzyme S subunit
MSFPRYPSYKDSGVEWLGEVPEHWEVISIKWLSPVKRGASPRPIDDPKYFDDEGEFAWVRIADVSACDGVLNETTQRLSEFGSSLSVKIAPGELFVSIAGTVGKPCISAIKACIHDGFVYFPTLKINPLFLYRIFEGGVCYGGLGKWGTQLNLNTDTIGSIRVALPPADELETLLEFLDRETGKIDELVAEQRRLMELLKEKRQAVISHAVTRGLNPAAPLKPSGIEWLGDVPQHWTVRRVKSVSSFITSGPRGWSERICEAGPIFVQSGDLNDSLEVEFAAAKRVQVEEDAETARTRLCDGDVVVCITGAKTGNVAVCPTVPETAYVNQHLCLIRPSAEILPLFLGVSLKSRGGQTYFALSQYGMKQGLSLEDIKEAPVFLPPIAEQQAIADFVESETAKFNTLTAEAQRAIALLQERRTALISAAVTGQIDVRAAEL